MINLEQVKTIYFDEDAMRIPSYRLGRAQFDDGRLYYRFDAENRKVELFNSLTTVIRQCSPMPYGLLEWYVRNGMTEAKRLSETAAMYGTLMHIEIGKMCVKQEYDFDKCDQVVQDYLSEHDFWQPECKDWAHRLRSDMVAWSEFVFEHNVKCLAVEMVLCSSKGFATAIDVVCDMDIPVKGQWGEVYLSGPRKGQPKETIQMQRKRVLINMKSGRHGFYESNGIQVAAEKVLFEENFPDITIDAILNWAPMDWGVLNGEKYRFKDWTGKVDPREIECMFSLAEVKYRDRMESKERLYISGSIGYGNDPKANNISVELLSDAIIRKELEKLNPDVSSEAEIVPSV